MNQSVISLQVDSDLKNQAMEIADQFGVSLTTCLKMALKKLVHERHIDDTLLDEQVEVLRPEVANDLRNQMKEKNRDNLVGPFDSADDFMRNLMS
jgi:addiction module RelB/DinJ family antitoxin